MADAVEGSLLKFKVELTFTLYGYPQKGKDTTKAIRIKIIFSYNSVFVREIERKEKSNNKEQGHKSDFENPSDKQNEQNKPDDSKYQHNNRMIGHPF